MTARASSPEYSCGSCRSLVLRATGGELADRPLCIGCGRIVCGECELLGYCPSCSARLWTPPVDLEEDERTLVSIGGASVPGVRPSGAQEGSTP